MIIDVDCHACNGAGEMAGSLPSHRARFVSYDDLSPDDYLIPCSECGGSGVVQRDPKDEVEDWMRD